VIQQIQKLTTIPWDHVQVRNPTLDDVDLVLDYFYEKTRPLPFRHFDLSKRMPESEWRGHMIKRIESADFSKSGMVVVDYLGKPIGVHTLTPILETHSDFHAHYWDLQSRGKKLVPLSWYKACDLYFKRFGFERLYFKPPKDNPMSSGACRYLPVLQLEDEVLDYPQLLPGIVASVYVITREQFYALK
jgi:hypothetical protein